MFNISHKKIIGTALAINITLSFLFVAIMVFISAARITPQAQAAGETPFGGLSTYVFYCTCSFSIAITIDDLTISPPLILPIIYQPGGTTLYPYGQVFIPGVWLLGLWTSGGDCEYYVGKGCSTYPTEGTMSMVGTSM